MLGIEQLAHLDMMHDARNVPAPVGLQRAPLILHLGVAWDSANGIGAVATLLGIAAQLFCVPNPGIFVIVKVEVDTCEAEPQVPQNKGGQHRWRHIS